MSDPVVELPEVMMAEMMKGTEKRSASQTTVSTLATSASMLSMATAVDEADLSGDITEVNLPQGDGQRRILRVRTLNESLSIPDISHGVERRSVGFDTLEIREYGIILGCNPGVSAGVPTTIDWKSLSTSVSSLEEYETNRAPRRSMLFLKKSKSERAKILKDMGYPSEELRMVEDELDSIRLSREESASEKTDLQAMIADSKRKRLLKQKSRGGGWVKVREIFGRKR